MNHYTKTALTALGDLVGKTKMVAFDPSKPITQDFIRVQVMFNVAHPLRKTKVINLPEGGSTVIRYAYEKMQKRCFTCQRLNHEQDKCPIEVKQRQERAAERRANILAQKEKTSLVLSIGDPLFGVLEEHQVGLDPLSGRPKIAEVVLEEMRNYLRAASEQDLEIRKARVRASLREVEKDPMAQRALLRLEPDPIMITDLNKGKGPVFEYGEVARTRELSDLNKNPPKLMAAAMKANMCMRTSTEPLLLKSASEAEIDSGFASIFTVPPTVFKPGASVPGATGMAKKRKSVRNRPGKAARNTMAMVAAGGEKKTEFDQREGKQQVGNKRRAVEFQVEENTTTSQAKCLKVVPFEGAPNSQ
ncbi:hypothetical protein Bca52824_008106 [Brassica carinata]|uniref:Zinc knuckle CX2CX4HX4C domain-containing protein n=1 Tax=Brassica carinata TaxID=52824 RepID=A0A8X7WBA8_BRACI|nr:hypothetical protein Bca52824_008106 [Brassica carinata]